MPAPPPKSFPEPPAEKKALELGHAFTPRFDREGLIPCVTQHADTGEVLMFAFMNAESLRATIDTGFVHYWSRSRAKLWRKGESSGMSQAVVELRTDCDQDVVLARVRIGAATADGAGGVAASCHVGFPGCFYRAVEGEGLKIVEQRVFDPEKVYGGA
ncbi:phosphoribosyl-AMP cyclohydrolase [Phycisphaera mikurensis]|uniref:Histidine biosynthesis bifunctional protein HisIE n=1 Tax=Phycisphaera mikurensis (strain NBRC 102666 / KCTC 22515 / FYK2301M01) TaxID=1142394 RepID=I0IIR8_PHYMF|nr:phosphoribosyl-AMP cyclohydrolase [Phycisphaera mikurensis]MBB6442694.1 phosphoribosyl-AMP cyclohydrolase [Phycisphaera mikurensis]BAM05156.1 phosphoribosyl-AMP cyclohydrolase [Phycisphaera mikurensis NBRC 102666]